jgi:hypothetical protein
LEILVVPVEDQSGRVLR